MSNTVPFYDNVGDFNINFLKQSPVTLKVSKILESFNLVQIINEPTRFSDGACSLIDVMITNNNFNYDFSTSVPVSESVSDHCLIYVIFTLQISHSSTKYIEYRDYNHINQENFKKRCNYVTLGKYLLYSGY